MEHRQQSVGRIPLRDDRPRNQQPRAAAQHRNRAGLEQHEPQDPAVAEPERLQHTELVDPFTDGLRHGVPGHEQDESHDDRRDGHHDRADVSHLLREVGHERLLGSGLRLARRVGEHRVNLLRELIGA